MSRLNSHSNLALAVLTLLAAIFACAALLSA
jgi:hypothetical protein